MRSAIFHSGVSRFPVGVVINGPSLPGTEHMPADELPRILVVQLHIPFRLLQPSCLPAPVSSAWQAVIIPLYCTVLSFADMVFPHLLLRWLWRPMIGYEKTFLHGKLFPWDKTGRSRAPSRSPSFRAIRGPPCSDCRYHGTHVPPESSPSHISLRSRPCLLTRGRPYGRTPAGNAAP